MIDTQKRQFEDQEISPLDEIQNNQEIKDSLISNSSETNHKLQIDKAKEDSFLLEKSNLISEKVRNSQFNSKDQSSPNFNSQKKRELIILEISSKVKGIHQKYLEEGILYTDPDFPALNQFLFSNEDQKEEAYQTFKTWEWIRPSEINKKACFNNEQNMYNFEIRLGKFSALNFANAVSLLTNQNQYKKIFVDFENMHMGYVICQFFKNGEWDYVIVDTLLPYSLETKKFLFTHNGSQEIFWIALLEKAYAKLSGNFNNIQKFSLEDILIDFCNCHISCIDFQDPEKKQLIDTKKLFPYLMNYQVGKEKYFLACIKQNQQIGKKQQIEMGEYGILENFMHSILSLEDVQQRDFKFFRIRNFWGSETNWSGPFSKNSDEWEKYKNLRDEFLNSKKYQTDNQNVYFMKYEYFVKEFNKIYIIKLFDNGKWFNYSHKSFWQNKSLSGPADNLDIKFPISQRNQRKVTQLDSDNSWFNNPQFRIKVFQKTKLYISLVQEDNVNSDQNYIDTNFCIIQNKKSQQRIWEFPDNSKIICQFKNQKQQKEIDQNDDQQLLEKKQFYRQIDQAITLDIFENKKYGNYNLIANVEKIKSLKNKKIPFFIKIFSNHEILFEELPQTIHQLFEGSWDQEKAGGSYYQNAKSSKLNPYWCLNPQYVMNITQQTYIKIILKKTGKNAKKMKSAKIGLTLCFLHHDKNLEHYQQETTKYSTKNQTSKKDKTKNFQNVQKFLTIPKLSVFQRKIALQQLELFIESTYSSTEIACLFLKLLPIEGPLLIIPTLEKQGMICDYKMDIFTNHEVEIFELQYQKNPVIISEWTQYTSGGSHIYNDKLYSNPDKITWSLNPVFSLKIEDFENFDFKQNKINIKLKISDLNWKSKLLKPNDDQKQSFEMKKKGKKSMINVDCMICFYILKVSKKITINSIVYQTPFSTKTEIDYDFYYNPRDFDFKNELLIMPCTYNSGIETQFILSAYCNNNIKLSKVQFNYNIDLILKLISNTFILYFLKDLKLKQ